MLQCRSGNLKKLQHDCHSYKAKYISVFFGFATINILGNFLMLYPD